MSYTREDTMSETSARSASWFKFEREQTKRSRLSKGLLLTAHCSLLTLLAYGSLLADAHAQTVVAKMAASVTKGSRATPDLITYSDLTWQLALEPDHPFTE